MTSRWPSRTVWFALTSLYVGLTLVTFWPLLGSFGSALPSDLGDPALNTWILWWNAQAVPLTERWWSPPMFYPQPGTLALSETLIGLTPFTTPLQWLGVGPVATYNLTLLASYPAAALAAHALAHRLTGRHDAGLVAGLAFGFGPHRAGQIAHMQMEISFWLPLGLLALHRFVDDGRARWAALAGLCWMGASLATGYFLVFFAVLIACWMVWFARRRRDWAGALLAFAVAAGVMAPLLLEYRQRQADMGLSRGRAEIENFSADLTSVWAASENGGMLASNWTLEPRPEGELYPGVAILVLVLIGGVVAWRSKERDRFDHARRVLGVAGLVLIGVAGISWWTRGFDIGFDPFAISVSRPGRPLTLAVVLLAAVLLTDRRFIDSVRQRSALLFYSLAAALMLLLALGPVAKAFGQAILDPAPYAALMELPGGGALRVPARFGILFIMCLGQAAALAFARLTPRGASRPLVAALAVVIVIDGYMPALDVLPVVPPLEHAGLVPEALVLELPLDHHSADTKALLRQIAHQRPLINGYSGYSPPHYDLLARSLRDSLDPDVVDMLRRRGPIHVLVSRDEGVFESYRALMDASPDAVPMGQQPAGALYLWPALPPIRRDADARLLAVEAIAASGRSANAGLMIDGDVTTRWQSAGPQSPGHRVTARLARRAVISRIEMDLGIWHGDYPRRLRIDVADEPGGPARTVWEGGTAGETILALLENHAETPIAIDLPPGTAGQEIIVTITAGHHEMFWTIAELKIWGR